MYMCIYTARDYIDLELIEGRDFHAIVICGSDLPSCEDKSVVQCPAAPALEG